MKRLSAQPWLPAAFLIAVFFLSALSPAAPLKKTLLRSEDFVLFSGEKTPSLIGSETRDLHLYSCGPSGLKAVPFQIDKRDPGGRYVFPNEKGRDPLRDGAKLDANDEMVFMVKDAGDRCSENEGVKTAVKGVEIELTDPLDAGRAWVYLLEQPGLPPPQVKDYVSYRVTEERELISTDQYELGQRLYFTFFDWLRLRRPDGSWSPDLLDRTKVGMKARLLNGAIPVHVPEQEIKTVILGVIDGPVRVIRDELDLVKIRFINLEWDVEYCMTHYFNGHISPIEVNVPFSFRKVFLEVGFYWAYDFNEAMLGSTFRNPSNPNGILLDGKQDQVESEGDNLYFTVTGPQGAIQETVVFDPNLRLIRTSFVRENLAQKEPAEDNPGLLLAGFWFKNSDRLEKGLYHYWCYHYYPYPFSERKVQKILQMIEKPVQIAVNPLAPPSPAGQ